jgi:hypothetical protein
VFRAVSRVVAGVVVVPFLALASQLAPAHAHERGEGHSHVLVHSHLAPHVEDTHDHDGAEIGAGAGHIVWLDSATIHALPYHLHAPIAIVTGQSESVPPANSWSVIACCDAAPPHGPPRVARPVRAPPALPV